MIMFECLLLELFWKCTGLLWQPSLLSMKLLHLTLDESEDEESKRMSFSHISSLMPVGSWPLRLVWDMAPVVCPLIDTEDIGEMDMEEMPSSSVSLVSHVRLCRRNAGRAPGLRYWGAEVMADKFFTSPCCCCCCERGEVDMDFTPESRPGLKRLAVVGNAAAWPASWQVSLTFMGAERVR